MGQSRSSGPITQDPERLHSSEQGRRPAASDPPVLPPFVSARPGGCTLRVRVIPRAGRSGVAGERDGALLVRLAAAPVDGEANEALIAFLARQLDTPRRAVRLVAGDRSRDKRLEIDGLESAVAGQRLLPSADNP
jgi:uncharacterized protein (TIGR00251 family)